ncbi:chloride channel protein [Thermosulfurimonas sp. F29]|uniref:chloride channel protein n=1 Tax=Thermosulfurimonas sp. F29 TaxID=2867247 RepID=UPI001C834E7C|nr:chloride channel protein [Thermosulfurimonas sp. F29]MBX6422979.1 chloride channel protein [Thermosulfurimonas sp. F29]
MKRKQVRLLIDAILLGVVGAVVARFFSLMVDFSQELFLGKIALYHPPGLPNEGGIPREIIGPYGRTLVPLVTTLGGFFSGLVVYLLAPEARGHGTEAAIKAFHFLEGHIRARVPWIKMVASAITLGSGGSAGREGPASQIGAGVGSFYGRLTRRPPHERRLLLLMGMSAALSAIFRSPMGTAFFAVEVLYSQIEFETQALIYCIFSAGVAYLLTGFMVGWEPLFRLPGDISVTSLDQYLSFLVLGLMAGIIGTLTPVVFHYTTEAFDRLPFPLYLRAALGGLLVGVMGLALPQVLGIGYGWLQKAIDGELPGNLMLIICLAKILAFSITIGSGGSGGDFAPTLVVGGMLGGFVAHLFHQSPAPYVVIGMASVFGAAARAPMANIFIVLEITGAFGLMPAAALSVMLAYIVQITLSSPLRVKSLYHSQVPSRVHSPAHRGEFFTDILADIKVKDIFRPEKVYAVVPEDMTLRQFVTLFGRTEQQYFPVVDSEGFLSGIFSINDVRPYLLNEHLWDIVIIRDIARRDVITTHPEEDINTVLRKFTVRNIDQLPVVKTDDPRIFLGMISRREVINFYNRQLERMRRAESLPYVV